jgi:hypothetical protein
MNGMAYLVHADGVASFTLWEASEAACEGQGEA